LSPAVRITTGVRFLLTFLAAAAAFAAPAGDSLSLDAVLAKMDAASATFKGMKADVEWVSFTALVEDKSVEEGEMLVRRSAPKAADLFIHFVDPYEKTLLVRGSKAEIYKPKIKTVEEYDLTKYKEQFDQAMLIGFGTSGKAIRESYEAKLLGEETVNGEPTVHLELIPKDADARSKGQKLEMWVSTNTWQTVQQKLYQDKSGDYKLYTYSSIQPNPKMSDSDFKLDLPKGVKRITPQK
jgi:outer membrane lipoprotein-sorting protein